ncbi:MAG: YpmA family protein [Actinobacteria bacterium]|nr:YpmA family protein [Actinomycetota bacterium]
MSGEKEQKLPGKLELLATKSFAPYDDMYRVVDFLNKSLKDRQLMFGLTRDRESGKVTVTIYEV